MRIRSSTSAARAALVFALALSFACGKKKEAPQQIDTPPPEGASTADELSIGLGTARALDDAIAPSSTKWRRAIVLDDRRAMLIGEVTSEAVAILTEDAGRTWKPLRMPNDGWSGWALLADGTVVLATGTRGGAKSVTGGTIDKAMLSFASFDKPSLTPPLALFPLASGPSKATLETATAIPFLASADIAALYGEDGRAASLFYGGRPGSVAAPPLRLPAGEKFAPVPYGRPPLLVSVRGRDLLTRSVPMPNAPLEPPHKAQGVTLGPTALADLSAPPVCESGAISFQRTKMGAKPALLGVSKTSTFLFELPDTIAPKSTFGCSSSRVAFETIDPKTKGIRVGACTFDGKCNVAMNEPFRVWPEQHDDFVLTAPTDKGIFAVLSQKAGARWGLYLAQSTDGTLFEVPRTIGEGKERSEIELGALLVFGSRALLLISAEVTGTSRRSWYAIATDDGGLNWAQP